MPKTALFPAELTIGASVVKDWPFVSKPEEYADKVAPNFFSAHPLIQEDVLYKDFIHVF